MRTPNFNTKVKFVDPFGGRVFIHYGGGDCVTIQQEGAVGTITMGKERAKLVAEDILKKLGSPVPQPETITQGDLPF